MKAGGGLFGGLAEVAGQARVLEQKGADFISSFEVGHDPLLQLAIAASVTEKPRLMTSITVAFGRSPMILANAAHDVNALSKGRLMLGIGSQIQPHIEKRYSMPWSKPAARMREYVQAMKAIWACWYEGKPLDFRGEFYTHTLMTPMFTPADSEYGAPPVLVAAVGPLMTENAAEVADGILLHAFTTPEYVRDVTLPAMEAGLAKSGRSRADLQIVGAPFIVTGENEEEFERVKLATRNQIAFYASTPAYRRVLESIGYGELQPELTRLSKAGQWLEMGQRIDDELLGRIALVGEPQQIGEQLARHYGGIFDMCPAGIVTGDAYSEVDYRPALAEAVRRAGR